MLLFGLCFEGCEFSGNFVNFCFGVVEWKYGIKLGLLCIML